MKSILIIGMGRFGCQLAKNMQELGNDVMIVDKDESIIAEIAGMFTDSHIGDCTSETVLRSLSVSSFDICFVTIGSNFQSSLVVTSLLKKLGARFIVAKAKQDIQAELLYTIGANEVIYPERDIAEKLAVRYNAKNIFDYIQLTDQYAIYEIPIPKEYVGVTIANADVRRRHNVNIIAIKHENALNVTPTAEYVFEENDIMVVIGKSVDVFRMTSKSE